MILPRVNSSFRRRAAGEVGGAGRVRFKKGSSAIEG